MVHFVGKANGAIALNATNGTADVWDSAFAGDLGNDVTACHNFTAEIASGEKLSGTLMPDGKVIVAGLGC